VLRYLLADTHLVIGVLARSAGELVTKDAPNNCTEPGHVVPENTRQVHFAAGHDASGKDRGMLKTASCHGYRLFGIWTICFQSRGRRCQIIG
jgi:hypothetical protein